MKLAVALVRLFSIWLAYSVATAVPAQAPPELPGKPVAETQPRKKCPVNEHELQTLIQAQRQAMDKRNAAIDEELKHLDRPALNDTDWAKEWAGEYYTGDGLGMNVIIKIAPKSGVVYTWHGCLGLYDANHGDIAETFPDGVRIKPAIDPDASMFQYMSERLYFVRWGDQRYLVPEAQMLQLVYNYNHGGYHRELMLSIPRKFEDLRQMRVEKPAPDGRPELPSKYARYIIEKPVQLRIREVKAEPESPVPNDAGVSSSRIVFEGGTNQNVFVGMELLFEYGLSFVTITIDKVTQSDSEGVLSIPLDVGSTASLPKQNMMLSFPGAKPNIPTNTERKERTPK